MSTLVSGSSNPVFMCCATSSTYKVKLPVFSDVQGYRITHMYTHFGMSAKDTVQCDKHKPICVFLSIPVSSHTEYKVFMPLCLHTQCVQSSKYLTLKAVVMFSGLQRECNLNKQFNGKQISWTAYLTLPFWVFNPHLPFQSFPTLGSKHVSIYLTPRYPDLL